MVTLALTGGIACGKSLVGAILERHGWAVCEADRLAHAAMEPGQPAHAQIFEVFGDGCFRPDGQVDRRRLGELVFRDAAARARLNAIVHPRVREAWMAWRRAREAAGTAPGAVVIIPLLFEERLESGWDAVLCVTAPEAHQRARLAARGFEGESAQQRLVAQLPVAEKARRSDYVIVNDGDEALLERRTMDVVNQILESKHGRTR